MINFLKKNWFKLIIIIILLIIVALNISNKGKNNNSYRTFTTKRGTLSVSTTGTGAIEASESRRIFSKVSSNVEKVYYLEGDYVQEEWPIAKLDSSDYEMTIKTQQNAVKQAEISKANLDKQVKNLKIVSSTDGYVGNLSILEGSYVMANTEICNITSNQKDEVTLQFVSSLADKIYVGDYVKVLLTGSLNYLDGKVSFVGNRISTLTTGATVIDVTIEVTNSKFTLAGVNASAEITSGLNTFKSVNSAPFTSLRAGSVKAETSGTVSKLYVKNGQYVKSGDVIAELENSDLVLSAQTAELNLQNLREQLKYANDKLKDYTVYATISGVITSQDIKSGDIVSMGSLITVISNKEELQFKIPVDELDIAKIDYDKEVKVTIDALDYTENHPIKGRITKMPEEGTAVGGVTDYYVTITIPGSDDIRISMNADAEIIIEEKQNVIYVPLESVEKENDENYVVVVNGENIQKRTVKTGLKGISYIEITSGLEEGEEVIVPEQRDGMGFMLNMY